MWKPAFSKKNVLTAFKRSGTTLAEPVQYHTAFLDAMFDEDEVLLGGVQSCAVPPWDEGKGGMLVLDTLLQASTPPSPMLTPCVCRGERHTLQLGSNCGCHNHDSCAPRTNRDQARMMAHKAKAHE